MICPACNGWGDDRGTFYYCPVCGGAGVIHDTKGAERMTDPDYWWNQRVQDAEYAARQAEAEKLADRAEREDER